mmetsp:Transcript_1786/g.3619  ORF Transcript_1786/g.3619 Transcript_1786/m.3619 type:complete len:361 (+) Transcript_1786:788-1870(+)
MILVVVRGSDDASRSQRASEDERADKEDDEAGDPGDGAHGPGFQSSLVFLADEDDVVAAEGGDLRDLAGLDFLEGRFEVVGEGGLGGARRAVDVVEGLEAVDGSCAPPSRSDGARHRNDRVEVLLLLTLVDLVRLLPTVAIELAQPPSDLGRLGINGILDDVVEIQLGRGGVMPLDLHGDGELHAPSGPGEDDVLGIDTVELDLVVGEAGLEGDGEDLGGDAPDGGLVVLSQEVPRPAGASVLPHFRRHFGTRHNVAETTTRPHDGIPLLIELEDERHVGIHLLRVADLHDAEVEEFLYVPGGIDADARFGSSRADSEGAGVGGGSGGGGGGGVVGLQGADARGGGGGCGGGGAEGTTAS